jgi:hypothetical protein
MIQVSQVNVWAQSLIYASRSLGQEPITDKTVIKQITGAIIQRTQRQTQFAVASAQQGHRRFQGYRVRSQREEIATKRKEAGVRLARISEVPGLERVYQSHHVTRHDVGDD